MKKFHRLIKFNQKAWLKPYIDINTTLREKAETNFEEHFLKLMDNAAFGIIMENMRKRKYIKTVTTEKREIF